MWLCNWIILRGKSSLWPESLNALILSIWFCSFVFFLWSINLIFVLFFLILLLSRWWILNWIWVYNQIRRSRPNKIFNGFYSEIMHQFWVFSLLLLIFLCLSVVRWCFTGYFLAIFFSDLISYWRIIWIFLFLSLICYRKILRFRK